MASVIKDPFYYCKKCGRFNDPFSYFGEEFEQQKKENICKRCKLPKEFGHEKAIKEDS
jgi:hypothetical protein